MALRIHLLGPFQAWRDGELIPAEEWKMEKNKALLKILVSQAGHTFTQDQLIEFLWPDADPGKASATLRRRVSELRYILEPNLMRGSDSHYILTVREGYTFNPQANCTTDVGEFQDHYDKATRLEEDDQYAEAIEAYEQAVSLYKGEYLEEDPYEEWVIPLRERWQDTYLDLLSRLADCHARLGHYRRAIAYCRQLLRRQKYRENVYRQLMLYYYAAGFQGEALNAYEECCRAMAELEVELAPETEELHQQILQRNIPRIDKVYPPPRVIRQPIPYSLGRTPFVGREEEYSKLAQRFEQLNEGRGGLVTVKGEAGVGKTRLIQEFLQQFRQDFSLLEGRCQEFGIPLAFYPLAKALRDALSKRAFRSEELKKVQPVWLAEVAQLVPELHEMFPGLRENPSLPSEQARLRQLEGWAQVFLALMEDETKQRKPLVLFLDDLQWADSSTVELLKYLLPRLSQHPLLLLGAYRSDEVLEGHLLIELEREARREGLFYHLELGRLSREAVHDLFQKLALTLAKLELFSDHIHRETEGNPFFIVAVLQAFFEEGAIRVEQERWVTDVDDLTVNYRELLIPEHVRDLIKRRLERLEDGERKLVELASVLGHSTEYPLLEAAWENVGERDGQRCAELLERLLGVQLLVEHGSAYQFSHDKIREIIYQELSSPRRQQWHLCAAQAFEAAYAFKIEGFYPQLAHHYFEAGEWQTALEHALQGLKKAVKEYRHEEGLRLAELGLKASDALEVSGADRHYLAGQRFELLAQRVGIYGMQGQRDKQSRELLQMEGLAEQLGDAAKQALAYQKRSKMYLDQGSYATAKELALKAMDLQERIRDQRGRADSMRWIGRAHLGLGKHEDALRQFQWSLETCREIGDRRGEGASLNDLGNTYYSMGENEKALRCHRQALQIHREIEDQRAQGTSLNSIGLIWHEFGKYEEALRCYQQNLAIKEKIGDRQGQQVSLHNISQVYSALGKYKEAVRYFAQVLDICRELGNKPVQASALNNIGIIYLSQGRHEQALQHFRKALEVNRELENKRGQAMNLTNIGIIHLYLGKYDKAIHYQKSALMNCEEIEDRSGQAHSLGNLGGTYAKIGNYVEALHYYQQSLAMFQQVGQRWGQGTSLDSIGVVLSNLGKCEEALQYLKKGMEIRQEIADRQGQGDSLNNIGDLYLEQGNLAEALKHYEEACTIFSDLEAKGSELRCLSAEAVAHLGLNEMNQALSCSAEAIEMLQGGQTCEDPHLVYFNHYKILSAHGRDEEAQEYLQKAYNKVIERSKRIRDPELRESFLQNVKANREIVEEWIKKEKHDK